ncbi:MAG TPA: xanthine dehydrogenase family protein subunit M [Gaiellaceae bacterium]|nr:xanthine dehydrogenase family protein subunit M [Gaiellaceae bacterium]
MIPAPFDYERAGSVDEAIELLGSREEAKLLAGGHSLLPLMKLRFSRPSLLVDIGRVDELSGVSDAGDRLAIGAGTRHHDLNNDPLVQEHCPIVSWTAGLIGDPQVRHRGTIGGSIAHGDPASDLPAVLVALDAELVIRGPDGERTMPAVDFCSGVFDVALGPQDVLTEVRVPKLGPDVGWSYLKLARRAQDWAMVAVAALVTRSNGMIGEARIALTNMGPVPMRAPAAEQRLAGAPRDAGSDTEYALSEAAAVADQGTDPPGDVTASPEFRRELARVVTKRALEEALSR